MPDRENVIKELKDIRDSIKTGQINGTYKMIVTINYAIDLLKEQEEDIKKLARYCYNVDVDALLGRSVM